MGRKVKKVKRVKKIRGEAFVEKRLNEAFDQFYELAKRYEDCSVEKIIEREDPTLKEISYFMLGFHLSESGKKKNG